jgi:Dockerin type I domain/Bacterial TSP3 repeat
MRRYCWICVCLFWLAIPSLPVHAVHADRVLNDLIAQGRFVGNFSANNTYGVGDVTLYEGRYYFCYAATTNGITSPPGDTAHFDLLPLVDSEDVVVNDSFDYSPGPLSGRHTVEGFVWGVTGSGYLNAYVDPGGFLSSSGNTYYLMRYLPGPITEFGTLQSSMAAPTTATTAISPNNLENNFSEMWHVNWGSADVGWTTYWHDGKTGVPATYKFYYNSGLVYAPGSPHELILKIRGKFLFGYVDGELAFIQLSDMFETLTAAANAVYTQNHSAIFGNEKVHKVWIKVSADSDGDGIRDNVETNLFGTNPYSVDSDGDGLVDGSGGVVSVTAMPGGIDMNSDGFVDGENDYGTSPISNDSDGDRISDGDEVRLYGTDPMVSNTGDVAPRGHPNNMINVGDLLVISRLVTGAIQPTTLESELGDINHDGQLNAADILLIERLILDEKN